MDAALREGARHLQAVGVPSPKADAEELMAVVCGVDRAEITRLRILGHGIDPAQHAAYEGLVSQRAQRVPLQYLTGYADFSGLRLAVGPGVFIPRPETEVLVEYAVRLLRELHGANTGSEYRPVVVDLCTGSGAIALAVKQHVPHAQVYAVEKSELAFAWAQRNQEVTGLDVDLCNGPAETASPQWAGVVDVVTCNPPYIPSGARPVDPEVRDHDPEMALYGGSDDGLLLPRRMADRAGTLLRPGGHLLIEHADVQGEMLKASLRHTGVWGDVQDHRDLTGTPRIMQARRLRAGWE